MARTAATITAQPLVRPENTPVRRSLSAAVLSLLGNLLFGLLLVAVVAVFLALTVLPRFVQFQPYVVLSGSMTPAIPVGSIVIAVPTDPKDIQVGDVISFTREGEAGREPITITHRVNKILDTESRFPSFETKGDANPVPDADPVRYLGPAGKVIGWVPHVGQFFLFGRTQQGRTLLLMVPGVLLAVSFLWTIWKPSKSAPQPAAEAGPAVAPKPQTPFAVEVLARADALLGDPSLTIEQRFSGLQPLIKRAERAGETDLARWLESRLLALVSAAVAPAAPATVPAVESAASAPRPTDRRGARRRISTGAIKAPAAGPARGEAL